MDPSHSTSFSQWAVPSEPPRRPAGKSPFGSWHNGHNGGQRSQYPSQFGNGFDMPSVYEESYHPIIPLNHRFDKQVQHSVDDVWAHNTSSATISDINPTASKGPSFANILQADDREKAPESTEEPSTARRKASRRGRIHPRIHPNEWKKYKDCLENLYIEKQMTTVKIKDHMKAKFDFDASKQQYKNKFSEWVFSKTLRKDGPPEEFAAATPIGVSYSTPATFEMVATPVNVKSVPSRPPEPSNSQPKPDAEEQDPSLFHLRSTWKGYTLLDAENMVTEAEAFDDLGKFEEAEHKFLEALAGFESLISPSNERTVSLAYRVAEFYAKNVRMHEADEILERAVEYLQDPPVKDHQVREGGQNTRPTVSQKRTFISLSLTDSTSESDIGDKPQSLGFQLMLNKVRVRAREEEAEPILLDLIKQCEKYQGGFSLEIVKARSALLDLYTELDNLEQFRLALKDSRSCVLAILKKKSKVPADVSLLQEMIELVEHFIRAGRYNDSESMFKVIEREITTTFEIDEPSSAIDCFVAIGMAYQRHNKWRYAQPRFEHALAVAIGTQGPESTMARKLEAALDNQLFSMAALPKKGSTTLVRRRLRR
ncbi:uncharacterized protein LY89DRAFT_786884 [Mollisia scopiformis]|uniref:Clr5 domain-containing protein n=1 Tax=Mollisia scopiformis TaxID=149040 RepID=A0A194WTH8_MOLSC|nr:uncharacterized protein LY89DRAFT_786884 [Mollisia scopiformis]KUJ11268.1 hypothetical protein LY89DRAFT_786884 [Mollisia scopiformis]